MTFLNITEKLNQMQLNSLIKQFKKRESVLAQRDQWHEMG